MTEIDHKLFCINDFMSVDKCKEIISLMESNGGWEDAEKSPNPPSPKYKLRHQEVIKYGVLQQGINLSDLCRKPTDDPLLKEFINHAALASQHKGLLGIEYELSVQVLLGIRNLKDGHFRKHQDTVLNMNRTMTALLYLSDENTHNLEGGKTVFWGKNMVHEVTPKAGTLMVYDPTIFHAGMDVINGEKYMVACIFGKKNGSS